MVNYNYECLDVKRDVVKGQITAENEQAAIEKLRKMGLLIIDLKEYKTAFGQQKAFFGLKRKVTLGELSLFSSQMSAMLSAGIPVTRALYTIAQQTMNRTLKSALTNIAMNVEGGMSLTDAFGMYPEIFSELYIAMIRSGEVGGMLDESLRRLADQLQKDKMLRDNIKAALSYPRMVAVFAVFLFIGMLLLLVPVFRGFMPEGSDIPAITQLIFILSDLIRNFWYLWFAIITVVSVFLASFFKSHTGKMLWDRLKFRVPVFGPIIQKSVLARFCRTFATLLDGGIPVIQALESAGPTSGSIIVTEAIKEVIKKIESGKNIATPMEESKLFPPMMIRMIAVGEETGSLTELLGKVAGFYEDEVATLTKSLTAMLEPIMLIVVGLVVGLMLISLYLPIFTAITQQGMY